MSAPDMEFIKKHYDKENVLVLVDSAQRDRNVYPNPGEYTMDLAEPIRLVYGMDILDATLPNVQYNVDDGNNLLCISTIDFPSDATVVDATILKLYEPWVPTGTTLQDILNAQGVASSDREAVNHCMLTLLHTELSKMASYYNDYMQRKDPTTKFVFFVHTNNNPFSNMTEAQVVAQNVSFEDPPTTTAFFRQTFDVPLDFLIIDNSPSSAYATDPTYSSFVYDKNTYYFSKERDNAYQTYQQINVANSLDEFFNSETTSVATIVASYSFALYRSSSVYRFAYYKVLPCMTASGFSVKLNGFNVTLPRGTYDFEGARLMVKDTISSISDLYDVDIIANAYTNKYSFRSDRPFFLDMAKSTCYALLGFDTHAAATGSGATYRKLPFGATNNKLFACTTGTKFVAGSGYNDVTLSSTYGIDLQNPATSFLVEAPDVANLYGVPYIVLRCDEIENCLYRNFPFGKQGVGMFKFDCLNELTHLRFDFVNFVRKPFHPIGKLVRLSFKFETPSGVLFDFKGRNYIMMVCLKCYVPKSIANFDRFTLNPNYMPDFEQYMQSNRFRDGSDFGEDEDEDTGEGTSTEGDHRMPSLDEYVANNQRYASQRFIPPPPQLSEIRHSTGGHDRKHWPLK